MKQNDIVSFIKPLSFENIILVFYYFYYFSSAIIIVEYYLNLNNFKTVMI